MNRRLFLKATGLSLTALSAGGFSNEAKGNGKKPNLLIIHTDEHNFRTLGCYRRTLNPEQAYIWGKHAVVETPNIDWIAEEGAISTKFYAATPVCSPSRASFLSGKYPQNTPVTNNNIPMSDGILTFAHILKNAGYKTGYSGKWHLDGSGKPQWSPERRFGFDDNRYMYNRGHWKKLSEDTNGPRVDTGKAPSYDVSGATPHNFTTDWLANRTIEFIKRNAEKPFCYMVSIPDPHGPDSVRAPYSEMFRDMKFEKPRTASKDAASAPTWACPKKGKTQMSQYFGMVKCIDDNVGRIIEHLKRNGLIDTTIIVFTADHGDLCGEHGRHNKGVPLEGSMKVPFLIRYPGKIKPGTVVKKALSTADFLPTILGLMGVETEGTEEGRDASALFEASVQARNWKDITFARGTGSWIAALTGRYKLVLSAKDDPWLIDMQKDPDELKNFCRVPEYAEMVKQLAGELAEYGLKFKDDRLSDGKISRDLAELRQI